MKATLHQRMMRLWYQTVGSYRGKYLTIEVLGGLCNKLFCLFSACDIALKSGGFIIEPHFGWKKQIRFSDIYDLDHFNHVMSSYSGGDDIMLSLDKIAGDKSIAQKTIKPHINLWKYSQKNLAAERSRGIISKVSTTLKVLSALTLRPEYRRIAERYIAGKAYTAMQMRIESDWVAYAKITKVEPGESLLVELDNLIAMIKDFASEGELFFTSGERQQEISAALKEAHFEPSFFYDPDLEYEINAAINFEICCHATSYIGLSRSTYSNLIALKRAAILHNDNSFIYNVNGKILRRIDMGLQPAGNMSISKKTEIL